MVPGSSQNVVFQHSRDLARNWRQGARRALIFNISAPCLGIVARKLSDTDFHHFCALTRKWRQGAFRHCFSTSLRPGQEMAPGNSQSVDFQHSRALDRNWRQGALRALLFSSSAQWLGNGARKFSKRRFSAFPRPDQVMALGSSQDVDFQIFRALAKKRL